MRRHRKTITFRDIEKLAESDLRISLKRGSNSEKIYGDYCGNEITIYPPRHSSKREIILTIIHECYHALEELNRFPEIDDEEIDAVAEKSLRRRPKLEDFIKELFSLKY